MFLRSHTRKKNGKPYRYWSVVESRRLDGGVAHQRQVLYLGEINDSQQAAWRKTISVFDEDHGRSRDLSLFPDDRPIPADAIDAVSVVLSGMKLLRPRSFGDCWLGCLLWRELHLDRFWQEKLSGDRGEVPWEAVLRLLAVNRLCDPGSEFAVHRRWFLGSAMDQLLGHDFAVAGKARRVWIMDRGIPTKATLQKMQDDNIGYLVGTPRHLLRSMEKDLLDKPWEQVHDGMRVKLLEQNQELFVPAQSQDRRKKENAIRRKKLKALLRGLNHLRGRMVPKPRRRKISRDQLIRRVAVLRKTAGRVASFITVHEPGLKDQVNRQTFTYKFDHDAWKISMERDGSYILRAWLPGDDWPDGIKKQVPALWQWYMQLTHVEEAFKTLKSDLHLRPIHHQLQHRVEAHILVAFLGYCLQATLRRKLQTHAPGLTPREVLKELRSIQMVDVHLPTTDGRTLVLPRFTEPEPSQQMILQKLNLTLPPQPPPRITAPTASPRVQIA
jgi:hypothetical protein